MKNLNKKWLYSLCAVVVLVTSSLTSNAQTNASSAVDFGSFAPSGRNYDYLPVYTTDPACVNNYGMDGNDYWMKITITSSCRLTVSHGSTSGTGIFDSVLHLLDQYGNLIASNDDSNPPLDLRAKVERNVYPGVYYVVLDGTSSKGHARNGGVSLYYWVN